MIKIDSCDIIRDLLPGYIDDVLSDDGRDAVKMHLDACEDCKKVYDDMKMEMSSAEIPEELAALDGFRKIKRRTKYLKAAVLIVSGLLVMLVAAVFMRVFVIGEPLSTHVLAVSSAVYDEESGMLRLQGTVSRPSVHVSRVRWEQSREDANAVNVIVYGAEVLPWAEGKTDFCIDVPDMKGRKAFLACPDYDRIEMYDWGAEHYEVLKKLEDAVYRSLPELDRDTNILTYSGGIEVIDGMEGVRFDVDRVIGENAEFWRLGDQIVVSDGDLEPAEFDVWIALDGSGEVLVREVGG